MQDKTLVGVSDQIHIPVLAFLHVNEVAEGRRTPGKQC